MLKAFTYGFTPELSLKEYRSIRADQDELATIHSAEKEQDLTTLIYDIVAKLLGRTALVFLFFVTAFLLRVYTIS